MEKSVLDPASDSLFNAEPVEQAGRVCPITWDERII